MQQRLSTLHLLCCRRKRKTRYAAIWLIFCNGTFTRKLSAALPSALEEPPKLGVLIMGLRKKQSL